MTHNVTYWIYPLKTPGQPRQGMVLPVGEGLEVTAFKLDANGEVVAARATAPGRDAGVPCTFVTRHELYDLAVAPHQKMGRHPNPFDLFIKGVFRMIQRVGKEPLDCVAAIFSGRQTDVMNHQ